MTGIIYFTVIVLANAVGAISGMGGGVIIKPMLDFIGAHSVSAISFYSTVAVFTMSVVSTVRQLRTGMKVVWHIVGWISVGAVFGGILGNISFERLMYLLSDDRAVQLIQIALTVATLIFAFLYTRYPFGNYHLMHPGWYLICGLVLGFLASLLGIGGGPINVALMMVMFSLPIKEATIYSICTIFFSQLAKLITIAVTTGFARYDMQILWYVIPAAVLGGLVGAKASRLLSVKKVVFVFQGVILLVLAINLYNGYKLF
ncbi:sulfite exporter TauE/SafE family protein [uncultured Trichococcus sp.]|uniref:sulfite exporter TauE/SafE family protein n=1 Tax=uncultured Trichococcus sp. TaxID=189665 RepID=UPI0029C83522|nr:sulfite exporter TauE/SafE family protein [uncultured Trichococcus sp.]